MNEKKNSPRIRFAEFNEKWVSYEFGNMISEYCEKTTSENEDVLLSCSIEGMFLNSELFSHQRGLSNIGYLKIKKGDLILSAQNLHLGNANVNLRFLHGIISPAYKVYDVIGCDSEFLHVWIKRESTKNFFSSATTAGASLCRKNIEWNSLYSKAILLPEETEQKLIAKLLIKLEKVISYKELRKQKLQSFKASMLEKMFPQDGADVPEVRFKEFTGAWERKYASELFSSYVDKGHPELPVLSATQDAGMIVRDGIGKSVFYDTANEVGYKKVMPGQFVIHLRSFQGGFAHSAIEGITSPAYTVFGFKEPEKHDDYYWKYVFASKQFIKRLETVTYGIRDGRSISYEEFLTLDFLFPQKEEQSKICTYLHNLDLLISLQQQELNKLQSIKKSLLDKMFV